MNVETKPRLLLHPSSLLRLKAVASRPKQTVLLAGPPNVGKLQAAEWLSAQIVGPRWRTQALMIDQSDKGTIAIDLIHEIRHFTQYKSAGSEDRVVVIINNAHTMGHEAQNSLLKLLEEPPEDLYIVLLSWQPNKLLPTIRSRVVAIDIQAPTFEQITGEFADYEVAELKRLYLMTNGSVSLIREILADDAHDYQENINKAKTLIGQSVYERLQQVDALAKDKPAAEELLQGATIVLSSALNYFAQQGQSVKTLLPKLEAILQARAALRKNHNTKLTLTLLFCSL